MRLAELAATAQSVTLETRGQDCSEWLWTQFGEDELAAPDGDGEQDIRILARRPSDGGVELGLQRRIDGGWLPIELPGNRLLRADHEADRWHVSDSLSLPLPRPIVVGAFRDGASLQAVGGSFTLDIDDAVHSTSCGMIRLRALADGVLAYTVDRDCVNWIALGTICPNGGSATCDVQRSEVYEWELRQLGASGIGQFELTPTEAQAIVDAIFGDYLGNHRRRPTVVESDEAFSYYTSSTDRIYLQFNDSAYTTLIHELGHALLDAVGLGRVSHGPEFPRLLIHLWERYLPSIDIPAAEFDAAGHGVELATRLRPTPRGDDGIAAVRSQLCDHPVKSQPLCLAFDGAMAALEPAALTGGYLGNGRRGDLWWSASVDNETGRLATFVVRHVELEEPTGAAARLTVECTADDRLRAEVWWQGIPTLDSRVEYRIGGGAPVSQRWRIGEGTWSGEAWSYHLSLRPEVTVAALNWGAESDSELHFSFDTGGETTSASFPLTGLFTTPAQVNLSRCGSSHAARDPDAAVIASGSADDDFWWGTREDDDGTTRTFVVMESHLAGAPGHVVRLQVSCRSGDLRLDSFWELDVDLDRTVRYRLGSRDFAEQEWGSGNALWGEDEFKWVGAGGQSAMIAHLAWAAAAGEDLTIETHAQEQAALKYTAVFDLNGLFETPVQPNLARCGR